MRSLKAMPKARILFLSLFCWCLSVAAVHGQDKQPLPPKPPAADKKAPLPGKPMQLPGGGMMKMEPGGMMQMQLPGGGIMKMGPGIMQLPGLPKMDNVPPPPMSKVPPMNLKPLPPGGAA